MLHFELQQRDKHGCDQKLIYCQLKLSSEAIKLLIETKGAIPETYMQALKDNLQLINENEQAKKLNKDKDEQIKKLTTEKDQEIKKLATEKDQEIKKLVIEMEEQRKENSRLKEALDGQSSFEK